MSHNDTEKVRPVVLAVDDTPQNLSLISDILEDEFTVKLATSGARALAIAAAAPPALVLLDIMMPEMDGYDVCRHLKADAATRDVPVIFVTAVTSDESRAQGMALGAVDYITKPVQPDVLRAVVRRWTGC